MANIIELSQEHEDNLRKLAAYLLAGELKVEFNMRDFTDRARKFLPQKEATECGSIGCAVGHGPFAGIPKTKEETWFEYSYPVFGLFNDNYWEWCFSDEWEEKDNSPAGAAKRMLFLLEKGLPKDSNLKMSGTIDLKY